MAAPRTGLFSAKSGPLAGIVFRGQEGTTQAYNRYQQARARALGFSSYRHERKVRSGSIFKGLITAEEKKTGKPVPPAKRLDLLKALGERQKEEQPSPGKRGKVFRLDVDFTDHSRGGSYDQYLQRIGRRTGNEEWLPGETP